MKLIKNQDNLILDKFLLEATENIVQKQSKDISWLAYAERKDTSWKINTKKPELDKRIKILEEIVSMAKEKFSDSFTHGEIANRLSILVNTVAPETKS